MNATKSKRNTRDDEPSDELRIRVSRSLIGPLRADRDFVREYNMKNVVGRFEEVNHHADVSTSEAEVNSRVRRLRAELDQVNDIDERDDLLSNQLANLDMNVRRAYVKALALEAFDQAQDLSLFLMQLSVATTGTRFHAELDVAVQELNELLEALSTTGDPDEVYMQVDGSTKREPGGP